MYKNFVVLDCEMDIEFKLNVFRDLMFLVIFFFCWKEICFKSIVLYINILFKRMNFVNYVLLWFFVYVKFFMKLYRMY